MSVFRKSILFCPEMVYVLVFCPYWNFHYMDQLNGYALAYIYVKIFGWYFAIKMQQQTDDFRFYLFVFACKIVFEKAHTFQYTPAIIFFSVCLIESWLKYICYKRNMMVITAWSSWSWENAFKLNIILIIKLLFIVNLSNMQLLYEEVVIPLMVE